MNSSAVSRKFDFAHWREWEPNPVLLKELRQAVRSNLFNGALLLLLTGLFLVVLVMLGAQDIMENQHWLVGQKLFNAFLVVLAITGLVFIPLYIGIRFAGERQQPDLMFFAQMSAQKIVRGKLSSGLCLAGIFFSACLPFMTFSSLFEGIDVFTILFVLAVLFAASGLGILAAIALASAPLHGPARVFLGIALTMSLIGFCAVLLMMLFGVVRSGVASVFAGSDSRGIFFATLFFGILTTLWLYTVSVTSIAVLRNPNKYRGENNSQAQITQ